MNDEHPGMEPLPGGMRPEELCEILRNGPEHSQIPAIWQLLACKNNEAVHACLRETFRNQNANPYVRTAAVKALYHINPEPTRDLVIEAIKDDAVKRDGPWWEAFRDGIQVPVDVCVGGMARTVAGTHRLHAAWLLLKRGEEGRKVLEALLRDGDSDRRAVAAVVLDPKTHPVIFDVLCNELLNGHRDRKWLRIIGRKLACEFGERFDAWVNKRGDEVAQRAEVVWVLAKWRLATGQATEDDILLCGRPEEKKALLKDLVRRHGTGAIPPLRRCLRDSGPRKATAQVFRELRRMKDAALPAVLEMLHSEYWGERKAAVGLLRHWGKLTPARRTKAMADPHIAVRHACLGRRWIR